MIPILWADIPANYRGKPVYTDEWGAYARFFPKSQHLGDGSQSFKLYL